MLGFFGKNSSVKKIIRAGIVSQDVPYEKAPGLF